MCVATYSVRNLGGLMPPAAVTSGPGQVGEAPPSEARPEGKRSRTTAYNRGSLEQSRVTSVAETMQGIREYSESVGFSAPME